MNNYAQRRKELSTMLQSNVKQTDEDLRLMRNLLEIIKTDGTDIDDVIYYEDKYNEIFNYNNELQLRLIREIRELSQTRLNEIRDKKRPATQLADVNEIVSTASLITPIVELNVIPVVNQTEKKEENLTFFEIKYRELTNAVMNLIDNTKFPEYHFKKMEDFSVVFHYVLSTFPTYQYAHISLERMGAFWNTLVYVVLNLNYLYKHFVRIGNVPISIITPEEVMHFLEAAQHFYSQPVNFKRGRHFLMINLITSTIHSLLAVLYGRGTTEIQCHDENNYLADFANPLNAARFYIEGGNCDKPELGLHTFKKSDVFTIQEGVLRFTPPKVQIRMTLNIDMICNVVDTIINGLTLASIKKYVNIYYLLSVATSFFLEEREMTKDDVYLFSSDLPFISRSVFSGRVFSGCLIDRRGYESCSDILFVDTMQPGAIFSHYHGSWIIPSQVYLDECICGLKYKMDIGWKDCIEAVISS